MSPSITNLRGTTDVRFGHKRPLDCGSNGRQVQRPNNQQDKPKTKLADRYQLVAVTDRSTNFALASLPDLLAELTG